MSYSMDSEAIEDRRTLKTLSASELVNELIQRAKDVEFWKDHGNWGDGHLETAKRDLANVKAVLMEYLAKGAVSK